MALLHWLFGWLNPLTWRADRRGSRELELAEERAQHGRTALLGARYDDGEPPKPWEPFYAAIGDAVLSGDKRVDHKLLINCVGPSPARDVVVWLAYGEVGSEVPRTDERYLGLLGAGDERSAEFQESEFSGGCVPRDGAVMCRWTDGAGTHTERLLPTTVWL